MKIIKKIGNKLENLFFEIIQRIPERFIPQFLMNRIERYMDKRILEMQQQIVKYKWEQAELEKTVTDEFGVDDLTDIIYYYFKITDESNIISILEHGDLELILRKIPVKEVTKHFEKDKISLDKLVELIPAIRNKDLSVYECALRSIFLSMLHKREVGEEHFDECIRLLIRGIVIQIMN